MTSRFAVRNFTSSTLALLGALAALQPACGSDAATSATSEDSITLRGAGDEASIEARGGDKERCARYLKIIELPYGKTESTLREAVDDSLPDTLKSFCDKTQFKCDSEPKIGGQKSLDKTVTSWGYVIQKSLEAKRPAFLHLTGIKTWGTTTSMYQGENNAKSSEEEMIEFYNGTYNLDVDRVQTILNGNDIGEAKCAQASWWEVKTAATALKIAADCGVPVYLSSFSNGASATKALYMQYKSGASEIANIKYYTGVAPNIKTLESPCSGPLLCWKDTQMIMDTAVSWFGTRFHYYLRADDGALAYSGLMEGEINLLEGKLKAHGSVYHSPADQEQCAPTHDHKELHNPKEYAKAFVGSDLLRLICPYGTANPGPGLCRCGASPSYVACAQGELCDDTTFRCKRP